MADRRLPRLLFAVYSGLMLWLLFHRTGYVAGIPYWQQLKINLIPLQTIRLFWRLLGHSKYRIHALVNLLGNIIMFIPLGYLLPMCFSGLQRLWKTLLVSALLIISVELMQLVTLLGSCDVDDLLLNLPGALVGYGLFALGRRIRE